MIPLPLHSSEYLLSKSFITMTNDKWQEPAATSSESLTKTSGPERRAAVRVPVSILVFLALVNTDVGGQY